MKYYRKPNSGNILALDDDGSQDHLIELGMVQLTDEEFAELRKPSLADAKADKLRKLKAARNAAVSADVAVGARTWPSDGVFKARITSLIARIGRGKPAPAKLRPSTGNAINTPTIVQLENIEDAITAQEEAAFETYWIRKDAVEAATTVEEVQAIQW